MASPLTFNPFRSAFGVSEPTRSAPPARRRVESRPSERAVTEPCGRPGSQGPRSGLRSASPLGGGGAKRAEGGAERTRTVRVVYRRPYRTPSAERPL
jgi:hypothetical protein